MADRFDVLITAEDAYPAFERAVLEARCEIVGGFRIFDLATRLRAPEARAIGTDWFDLLEHALRRGVRIHMIVSDFDPVFATALHEIAWRTCRQFAALAETSGARPEQLRLDVDLHPAKAGMFPWLGFLTPALRRRAAALHTVRKRKRQAVGLSADRLPRLHTVSHHQKLAVIDGKLLYVGGLDLNERRWDTRAHDRDAAQTWSDVQVLMTGPEAGEARDHLKSFVAVCAGRTAPSGARHIKRTLSKPRRIQFPFLSPLTVLNEIEEAHLAGFRAARHHVHIETQYLRSSVIADGLAKAGRDRAELGLTVILPALPEEVAFGSEEGLDAQFGLAQRMQALQTLRAGFGDRLCLASPVRPILAPRETRATLAGSPLIHVHNKVLLIDDARLMIGSANLNGRSMRWDTEVAVETRQPHQVDRGRDKLFDHWWFAPLPDVARRAETRLAWWQKKTREDAVMRPEARRGFLVPFDETTGRDLATALPGVTENMV